MDDRRILVTGGRGMLAQRLKAVLEPLGRECLLLGRDELDVTAPETVSRALEAHRPGAVVNTAAMLVEDCEKDPRRAMGVNAWGVRNLALECARTGAALVQISTSGLFGDEVMPYHEYSPVVCKTWYARSKYEGENYARLCEKHLVVRLGWLYGGSLDGRKDFVSARIDEARGKVVVESTGDKFGSPTNACDAALAIHRLLDARAWGLYHLSNPGGCSRAQYTEAILQAAGMDTRVEPIDSSGFPRLADVPDCEILESWNLEYAGIEPLPYWRDSLEAFVAALKKGA